MVQSAICTAFTNLKNVTLKFTFCVFIYKLSNSSVNSYLFATCFFRSDLVVPNLAVFNI